MDSSKMTRVAKNLDTLANVGGKIAAACAVVCVLVAAMTLVFGGKMFAADIVTLDLDFIKFHLTDAATVNETCLKLYAVAVTLGGGIICALIWYVAKLLRDILSPMKLGRPFEAGVSEGLRKIGWAILAGGLFSEVMGVVSRVLLAKAYSFHELFATAAIAETEFVFTMDMNFVLTACVIFLLSYIFKYGQALQQDSDETL